MKQYLEKIQCYLLVEIDKLDILDSIKVIPNITCNPKLNKHENMQLFKTKKLIIIPPMIYQIS